MRIFHKSFAQATALVLTSICYSVSYSALAFASSKGAAHAPEIGSLFWPTMNFVLYIALMTFLYGKFARPALRTQRTDLETKVVKIQNEHDMLNKELDQLKEQLVGIDQEKSKLVAELEVEARAMADLIIAGANKKAERIKLEAGNRVASDKVRLEQDVKSELLKRVVNKVSTKLRDNFSEKEDSNYIKSFLSSAFKQ